MANETARTLAAVQNDGLFQALKTAAERVLTDPTRLEDVDFIDDGVFQYWQDRERPLGIWRQSSKSDWLAGRPQWQTVLDLDALSRREGRIWIFAGADCRNRRCLVRLSENGKDAAEVREFDLASHRFVAQGFVLPLSKGRAQWYDDDTLLIAPVLGKDSVNRAKLPNSLRLWKRGEPLADTKQLFRILDEDAMLSTALVRAADTANFLAVRHTDFERREYMLIEPDGRSKSVALPDHALLLGVHKDRLLLRPNFDWQPPDGKARYPAGSVVSISLARLMRDGVVNGAKLIFVPPAGDAVRGVVSIGNNLIITLLHNYSTAMIAINDSDSHLKARSLSLPSERYITSLGQVDGKLVLRLEAPLAPESLALFDPTTDRLATVYARSPAFNTADLVAERRQTRSRDGTIVDYLMMRRRDLPATPRPTLIYGYGGYDVPVTPRYEPLFGKLWLERGGVYIHAYLRGGGEHGPAWHRGAMRTERQQPYDDMAAVVAQLQSDGIASPATTGIIGRSNGGLMTAVIMEQIPDKLGAVIIGGPLIDMLDYDQLPPGNTWTAEYGDPRDPGMRSFLASYSPMQNIAPATTRYPIPLLITSSEDDRVAPGHARRFAARLAETGHKRLYFEDKQGGHYWELAGGPAPGDWRLRATARAVEFSYLWNSLGRELQPSRLRR